MNFKTVYVFVKTNVQNPAILAGRLDFYAQHVEFKYSKEWVIDKNGFAFHPSLLPLSNTIYSSQTLDGALSVFRDSGPGLWGKEILKKQYGTVDMAEALVLSNNLLRIGAFRYSKEMVEPLHESIFECSIADIYTAIQSLENGESLSKSQSMLLEQGSSMDGMRPKSFITINDSAWIVKFPSKHDYDNKAINELIGMRLAEACHIETPEVRILPLPKDKKALAVKRFDINGSDISPLMSVASAMGFLESEFIKKDYRWVAQTLIRMSSTPKEDCESLFRRMALNVMISNRDDHIFNQAFIRVNGQWKLSPVYDVVCGEGNRKNHAMSIGEEGASGNLHNVMSSASDFGLTSERAKSILDEMIATVSNWKELIKDECSQKEIVAIEWSILHQDIFNPLWHYSDNHPGL